MDPPLSAEVAAALDRCGTTCRLLPEQEEGPYRRGDQPRRREVTEGRPGSSLRLGLRLRLFDGRPAVATDVEIWHCDADGRYSGYPPNDPAVAVDASPQRPEYLTDETFLRGGQMTDETGSVEFATIYPGWYPGRTVHIHLLVRTARRSYVSQLYFPENVTADVFAAEPYRHRGRPDTTNATDGIFATGGGEPAVLDLAPAPAAAGPGRIGVLCLVLPPGS